MLDKQVVHFDNPPLCLSPDGTGDCTLPAPASSAGAVDSGDAGDAGAACPAVGATVSFDGGVDAGVEVPSDCDTYCGKVMLLCPTMFPSTDVCRAMCALSGVDSDAPDGSALACRETSIQPGPTRCMDSSLITEINCTPGLCPVYCVLGRAICGSAFPEPADCAVSCAGTAQGEPGDAGGNTLECRVAALEQALVDKSFCAWAAPAPTCGPCRP
jgi:hypothetical protein